MSKDYKFTEEDIKVIKENFATKSLKEIQDLLAKPITYKRLRKKCWDIGLRLWSANPWSDDEIAILKESVNKNLSFDQISKLFNGRTRSSIQHKANKLKLTNNYRNKTYCKDETFWETPNVLNSYWAGFFTADGCLLKNSTSDNYGFVISLCSRDLAHLEQLKNDVKFSGEIKTYQRKNYKKETLKGVSTLGIFSIRKWMQDLEKNFGIRPDKTKRFVPPNLGNLKLELAFLKGYVNGDGWIIRNKCGKMTIGTVSSNLNILSWIHEKLLSLTRPYTQTYFQKRESTIKTSTKKCFYFTIDGFKAALIFEILSKINTPILERKWLNPKVLAYVATQKEKYPEIFQKINEDYAYLSVI